MASPRSTIAVGRSLFKGAGEFSFHSDQDAWARLIDRNEPFTPNIDTVAEARLKVGNSFAFGRQDFNLTVKTEALHQARILWPGKEEDEKLAAEYGLAIPPSHLYARLLLSAEGAVDANGSFPVGPLSATVGVQVGGNVAYERWRCWEDGTPARHILADLYDGVRLPQHIDSLTQVPGEGELLVTRFGGYLHLTAGLAWGYSLAGSRPISAGALDLDLNYKLRAMAAVNFGFRIAGDFQVEALHAADDGWVRFVVRKSRDSQTTLAADFGLDAAIDLKGLPASADEFLAKALGAHAERALDLFQQARHYASLDELEKAAGKFFTGILRQYAGEALGIVLDNSTFQDLLGRMRQVADAYQNLDKRVIDLYHDVLNDIGGDRQTTLTAMETILGVATREDLLQLSGTERFSSAIDLLRRLYNERLFELLRRDDAFLQAIQLVQRAHDFLNGDADAEIKRWIRFLKDRNPLQQALTQLARWDTPGKIRKNADDFIQGLVEKLLGRAFDQLADSDLASVVQLTANNLRRLEDFKNKWYAALTKAVHDTYRLNLHLAYSRTRRNERLLDVEINLNAALGPELARQASRGDFEKILALCDPRVARINRGLFADQLKQSAEIKVDLLGWSYHDITSLVLNPETSLLPQPGGVLRAYSFKGYVERHTTSGWKQKEEARSKFLVNALGSTFQAAGAPAPTATIHHLESLSAEYSMLQDDPTTSPEELEQYLGLASEIGLLDQDPHSFVQQLLADCNGKLGKVSVNYSVSFNPSSLDTLFLLDAAQIASETRAALRRFILLKYALQRSEPWLARVAYAYADPQVYAWYRSASLSQNLKQVFLPAWYLRQRNGDWVNFPDYYLGFIRDLFGMEDSLVAGLTRLDEIVEQAKAKQTIRQDDLDKALGNYLQAVRSCTTNDPGAIVAVLDRLVQLAAGGSALRDSAVILEITPSSGPLRNRKVTRVLAAGPKNPQSLSVES